MIIPNTNQNFNKSLLHDPFGSETFEMRNLSILFIECYGFIYLFAKLFLSLFNTKKSFFTKMVNSLLKQTHFFFLFLTFVYLLYISSVFDSIKNNWQLYLGGVAFLGIFWLISNIWIIIFSTLIVKKWEELEEYAKSFCKKNFNFLIFFSASLKEKLEDHFANVKETKYLGFIYQSFEYLTLKIYFSVPLFPIFKKMTMRKDFKFCVYLKNCLAEKLRMLFKFSFTCLIISIFWILLWHILVAPLEIQYRVYILFPAPFLGILVTLILYAYLICIYRKVVIPAENIDLKDYHDLQVNHQNIWDQNPNYQEPAYIQECQWDDYSTVSTHPLNKAAHLMINNNYPSLYDENMFAGSTGFALILNYLQTILFLFCLWSTLIFSKEIFNIYKELPIWQFVICILSSIIYFFLYTYLISISIRWYTIISSIETRRNEKCLNKTIKYQMCVYAKISQSISYSFKKIFYDNFYEKDFNNSPFKLSITNFQKKLNYYVRRFKGILNKEKNPMEETEVIEFDIKNELPHFLVSCGMELNEEEMDFILHISGEKANLITGKLEHKQLDDIWAGINYFCSKPMHEIVRETFENYFGKDAVGQDGFSNFNEKKISDFLLYYKDYFTEENAEFIQEELQYLGARFSLDAFIFRILGYGSLNSK